MTVQRFGVGIIGAGPVTQAIHLPTLARLPDLFDVVSIMDVDAGVAGAVAQRAGARAVTTADEVMSDDRVEIVAICSPPQFHADQVLAAIAAGKKAILCEKPFAISQSEAQTVGTLAAKAGVPIVVGAMHTFDPAWAEAAGAFDQLGEQIRTVRSTIVLPFNDRYEDWATQIYERRAGTPSDIADPEVRRGMISAGVLGLAVHNLPLVRRFVPTFDRVASAEFLPPFGYAITLIADGQVAELVGRMDRQWRPDWTFDAIGDRASIHAEFPPSYVQAGSSTVTVHSSKSVHVFGPYDTNGYEAEWRHLADLASGIVEAAQPLQSVIDDLTYTVAVADGSLASFNSAVGVTR